MKREFDIEKAKQKILKQKAEEKAKLIERWNNMKPFENVDDIPDIPIMETYEQYDEVIVKNLIRCGAIPIDQLEIGATYEGNCRNFEQAKWDGKVFWGKRYKFGEWHDDKINHFQTHTHYDVFVPIKKVL
jgi:hypothetical protein